MFLRIFCVLLITGWFSVNCVVPVPPKHRKAELALNRYISSPHYHPVIYSLLNVLIHVKQAKAFISDEAINMALGEVKEFDQSTKTNNVKLLCQIIYGRNCKKTANNRVSSNQHKINPLSSDLKQRIVSELDNFFENISTGGTWTNEEYKKK